MKGKVAMNPAPDTARKFICDAMLGRPARWLRAAGYDTTLASGREADRDLLRTAIAEDRLLLTLDRDFHDHKAARGHVAVLEARDLPAQARELKRSVGVDWVFRPFSRCVVDNTPLRPATTRERAALPPRVRARAGAVLACPCCGRAYWSGDHHARMRERLESWARA